MNNSAPKFSSAQLNSMLAIASKKLGTSPEALRQNIEQGNIAEVVKKMGGHDAEQVSRLLNNKEELEKLMNSPQVKELINKLNGK